jgi:hypothetical protein
MSNTIDYEGIGREIGKLVTEKQKAYGDSYSKSGEVLKILFPDGVKPAQFIELLAICRVLDKIFRLATDPDYGGESPWADICGYSLLRLGSSKSKNPASTSTRLDEQDITPSPIELLNSYFEQKNIV